LTALLNNRLIKIISGVPSDGDTMEGRHRAGRSDRPWDINYLYNISQNCMVFLTLEDETTELS
jgi:hypothetical protein